MSKGTASKKGGKTTSDREDRLKVALKANLQRRKAQARARTGETKSDKAG